MIRKNLRQNPSDTPRQQSQGATAMTANRTLFPRRTFAAQLAGASALAMVTAWASPAMAQINQAMKYILGHPPVPS
jgi:hypothetical protein